MWCGEKITKNNARVKEFHHHQKSVFYALHFKLEYFVYCLLLAIFSFDSTQLDVHFCRRRWVLSVWYFNLNINTCFYSLTLLALSLSLFFDNIKIISRKHAFLVHFQFNIIKQHKETTLTV